MAEDARREPLNCSFQFNENQKQSDDVFREVFAVLGVFSSMPRPSNAERTFNKED